MCNDNILTCYSIVQLKKVRLRATFASQDTAVSNVKLSCCEHYGNVLNEYNNMELKAVSALLSMVGMLGMSVIYSGHPEDMQHSQWECWECAV